MSDANKEISNTVNIQGRTALGLTLGLACSIPLSTNAALAAGNHDNHVARHNFQLTALQQLRAERRADRRADRADRLSNLTIQNAVQGANFNLNSGREIFSANNLGNFQSLTIDVGGTQKVVTLNSKLSAAEVVAAQQVLNGGVQTIELKGNGSASGGTINLNNSTLSALDKSAGGSIGSLTVARNVQVIDSTSGINLTGTLRNQGTISAASDVAGSTLTISADTIHNARTGSIGSYVGTDFFSADVALNAATSLTNNGSISSAGTLTITAPVINNLNDGSTASLSAGQNVNLNTSNLVNTGVISAANDINVASNTVLNVVGTGGSMQANSINFGTSNSDINITGGDLLSQDVNLTAGKGTIEATAGQVSGIVNASACIVHFNADTADLKLGDIDASGDPIFTNAGNIQITGAIAPTGGAPLTIIAGGDITATAVPLSTAGAAGGGDMTLLAGVAFTKNGANFNVSKKSKSGGGIDLTGITSITSAGGTGAAGDITMVAFAGKTVGTGTITFPTGITMDATGAGGNGDVLLLGSAKTGAAFNLGGIKAGNVTIKSSTPSFSKGGITYDATGALVSGSFNSDKITSGDININATLDATGDIVIATTSTVNVNGSIKASSPNNAQNISIQSGDFKLNAGASILSNDDSIVTINTSQPFVVTGLISVGTLNLTAASLDITATGTIADAFDNITTSGNITVNGTLGRNPLALDPTRLYTTFNINDGGTFVVGDLNPGAVVSGDGQISADSFINNGTAKGNITYNASASGLVFTNNGVVDGQIVTINAVKGTISNAAGAFLQATQQTADTDVPTLTLNTLALDNQGHIEAVGELKRTTGTLNINSTKALTITGADNSFYTAFNSSVNLSALNGDVTVGGNNGVVNSNPFGLLSSGLGNFSVVAPKGTFNSTMPGVSVTADTKGKQGTILFNVEGIVYNGLGAAPNFALKAVGDPMSKGVKVVTINSTAKDGITIGKGAGEISIDISGFESTSTTSITTPTNLKIDSSALKLGAAPATSTGLVLTGTKNLLITGNVVAGDSVTINTGAKKKPFQIGNATVTGINGLAAGEGISAIKTITITGGKRGFVMDGNSLLTAGETITLNGSSLVVNSGSDIKSTDLTLNPGASTKVKYANFNPLGAISAARLHIATTGTLTLDSGGGKNLETFLTVGVDKSNTDPTLWEGGTFDLSAGKLAFSSAGITFNAPGNNVDAFGGGQVFLKLSATSAAKVGLGNAIRANVSSFGGKFPASVGEFRLNSSGSIVAKNVLTDNVIQYGPNGPGTLELNAGTTVQVSGVNNSGWNLFHLTSNSTQALLASDATSNGVTDSNVFIAGGGIVFDNNVGKVVTNGAFLIGVDLELHSATEIDVRKNAGSTIGFNGAFLVQATTGPDAHGGIAIYDAPLITVDSKLGHSIYAEGSANSGGDITINSTGTSTVNIGGPNTGGAFYFDVSDTKTDQGGKITVNSGGAIVADGAGFNFGTTAIKNSALNLKSGSVGTNPNGFPIQFNNASASVMTGLDFGTVTIDSGSTSAFKMNGAGANGFTTGDISAGKLIISPQTGLGIIDTTGYQAIVHDLLLQGTTVNFANQTISVVADGAVGTGSLSGDGGHIKVSAESFGFDKNGGVLLSAPGTGANGGIIVVEQTGTKDLTIGVPLAPPTFTFNVSNPGAVGGEVDISTKGDLNVDGSAFTYGTLNGGKLSLQSAGNQRISGIASLSAFHLGEIDFLTTGQTSQGAAFQFGGADSKKGNGIVDPGATLIADFVKIESTGSGAGIDTVGGTIAANHLSLKTDGSVNFASGSTLAVVPSTLAGTAGNGGTLEITALGFTQSGGVSGYTLSAAGSTGAGGLIQVTLTGSDTLVIGNSDLNIDISNASGFRGGNAIISNGGNITADISAINVGSTFGGQGPNLALNAKGILNVSNVGLIANIGFGGGNFTTATIGGVPMTGYTNVFHVIDPALPGGEVLINYVEQPGQTADQIATFIANQINTNPQLQTLGVTATTSGAAITLVSNSNNTTYDETCIAPLPPADQECPATVTLVSQTTGITFTSQSSQAFKLGGAAPGTNGITDAGPLALNIGAVTIANTGSSNLVTVSGGVKGGTDSITVTDPALPGGFVTVSVNAAAGTTKEAIAQALTDQINLNLDLQGIGVAATVNGAEISLTSTGVATTFSVLADGSSKLTLETLSKGGNIVNGTITNLAGSITDSVTLSASGNIGTQGSPMIINGNSNESININAGGDSYFSSNVGAQGVTFNTLGHTEATFTAGDIGQISGSVGDLRFNYLNANAANTNAVNIATLTSLNGDLAIIGNAGFLNVLGSAKISSNFGNIELGNTRPGGQINIGSDVIIHGSGAVTALNQGNVYIYNDTARPTGTAPGITPPGVTIDETGGGKVTFGSNFPPNPAGTITADPTDIFQALGRNLSFNNVFGTITVGANAVITADPPPLQVGVQIFGADTTTSAAHSNNAPALQATALATFASNSAASNTVPTQNSTQQSSANVPNFLIDSAQNLLSALSTINTVGLNNAQLTDLSSVQTAQLNSAQVSSNATLLSTASVGDIAATLPQASEEPQTSDSHSSRTLIGQVSNAQTRKLDRGPLLVAPENDIVVETPFGKVNVAAKTLALMIASDTGVAIYNLHDVRKGALTVTTNVGHTFNVTPGTSAVLVNSHDKQFEDVNPARFVRYRQPVAKLLNNSHKLYRAEFEILSLLNGLPAVKDLMTSENKETRKTMMNVLKTAAILMQLSGNAEPFKFICKPDVTAMNSR